MPLDLSAVRPFSAILVAVLCVSAAGCALTRGDFAPRSSAAAVATNAPSGGPLDLKPAVLVQDPGAATVTGASPQHTASVDGLPQLPKGDAQPVQPAAKALSPTEKARVIAELEALARGEPATPTATAKPDCTVTASTKSAPVQTAAAASCAATAKPAQHP